MIGARLKGSHTDSSSKKRKMTEALTTSSCSLINREWNSLPLTVVFLILDKLLEPADHIRFGAICNIYNSLAKHYNQANQLTRQLNKDLRPPPMLLIRNNREHAMATLCSVSEGKVYGNVEFPELPPSTIWYYSCGHGWLASEDERANQVMTIALRNPFRKPSATIRLPFLNQSVFNSIGKIMLSEDPALNPDSYVVGVTYGCWELAFIRARDQHWTHIQERSLYYWDDVILYKSQIYTVGSYGEIVSVKLGNNHYSKPEKKLARLSVRPEVPSALFKCRILVESSNGDLLYVERIIRSSTIEGFRVYKVVFSDGDDGSAVEQLLETRSIGDEAVFVDDKHAVSVSASKFPKCQRNSIYYTTDLKTLRGPDGMSTFVFNLEDGIIKQLYPLNTMQRNTLQKLWIMPSFNGLC